MSDLAPYAAREEYSRGRHHPEPPPGNRGEYQRDRDRIIHSAAFRRLEYKTQVFINHEGDHFRTRLTHSLEVAQLARTVARNLRLNLDLSEAISLAHDLGHTPFGHAGQEALNTCMKPYGGFEHNVQSLRVVDHLEDKYASFRGLNLSFETREGILKHCSLKNARKLGDVGERFLQRRQPSLEAQLANVADEIAYNNHDIDDGLRAELLAVEQMRSVSLFRRHHDEVLATCGRQLNAKQERHETIRRIINTLVVDLTESSRARITGLRHIDEVRAQSKPLMVYSDEIAEQSLELKRFLLENLYRQHRVYRMTVKAQRVVRALFEALLDDIRLLPPDHLEAARKLEAEEGPEGRARAVADYIAGMTDRYALDEHDRLFDARRLR